MFMIIITIIIICETPWQDAQSVLLMAVVEWIVLERRTRPSRPQAGDDHDNDYADDNDDDYTRATTDVPRR